MLAVCGLLGALAGPWVAYHLAVRAAHAAQATAADAGAP